jgi:hypothetical protein
MAQVFEYYERFQGFRGRVKGLPGWGRWLLVIGAIPGIVLVGLSILALIVSILALLLLTVPVYRLLSAMTGAGGSELRPMDEAATDAVLDEPPAGRRHVEVRILDDPSARNAEG